MSRKFAVSALTKERQRLAAGNLEVQAGKHLPVARTQVRPAPESRRKPALPLILAASRDRVSAACEFRSSGIRRCCIEPFCFSGRPL